MSSLLEVTVEDFDRIVSRQQFTLVYISAPWCAPCKIIGPHVEALGEEMREQITFVKFNGDGQKEFLAKYEVRGVPTFIVFNNGEVLAKQTGAMSGPALKKFIEVAIAPKDPAIENG